MQYPDGVTRARLVLLVALALASACGDGAHELFVDLRTDMAPGTEFDNTVVELRDARGRLGSVIRSTEAAAISSHDYTSGRRVAELVGLPGDDYVLRVELELESSAVVDVIVPITLTGDRAETVFVTRDCTGRTCPMAGDDPGAVGCLHGQCVDPECLLGRGAACASPMDGGVTDGGLDGNVPRDGAPADADEDVGVMDTGVPDGSMCSFPSPGVDRCLSSDDIDALGRSDLGPTMNETPSDLAYRCSTSCLGSADADCVDNCIVMESEGALSVGCAHCFAAAATCAVQFCLRDCIAGADDPSCAACRAGGNSCAFSCDLMLEACTGVSP
jgi:hypothetical protein